MYICPIQLCSFTHSTLDNILSHSNASSFTVLSAYLKWFQNTDRLDVDGTEENGDLCSIKYGLFEIDPMESGNRLVGTLFSASVVCWLPSPSVHRS